MVRSFLVLQYILIFVYFATGSGEFKTYLSTERPIVIHVNPKYLSFFNVTTTRFGRRNPVYYLNIHASTLFTFDNNVVFQSYFYEYYSSQYRRSFLELSYKWCNLYNKDQFFGSALRRALVIPCPHKPDTYHLQNMTANLAGIPNFPYVKGRIYCNITLKNEVVFSGYIDMELKRMRT